MTSTETTAPALSAPSEQPLQWSDEYAIGFPQMDAVHEEFVGQLARLQMSGDAELPERLAEFSLHCAAHFAAEDNWMRETEFPPRDCHIDEHAAVLRSLEEVEAWLAGGDVEICRKLIAELADWFPRHTAHLDSALAHWMSKRNFGGKPVVLRRDVTLR